MDSGTGLLALLSVLLFFVPLYLFDSTAVNKNTVDVVICMMFFWNSVLPGLWCTDRDHRHPYVFFVGLSPRLLFGAPTVGYLFTSRLVYVETRQLAHQERSR